MRITLTVRKLWRHEAGLATIEFIVVMPFLFLLVLSSTEIARAIIIKQKVEQIGYTMASAISSYRPGTKVAGQATGQLTWDVMNKAVFPIFDEIMDPYVDSTIARGVIVTSVYVPAVTSGNPPSIRWQVASGNGDPSGMVSYVNNSSAASVITARDCAVSSGPSMSYAQLMTACYSGFSLTPSYTGGYAVLSNYQSTVDEGYVVVEAFYDYKPILDTLMNSVNGAAGTAIASFNFTLPETLMSKRSFIMSRNGPLMCLPPTIPCDS